MSKAVDELVKILDIERIDENIFRGFSPDVGWQRVFGGLVIAQALTATERTVKDRIPHSLHAYFILPGDPVSPIIYKVERIRDGGSFSTRRCVAIQHGHPIFSLSASFHKAEEGLDHAWPMPDVPPPEKLLSEQELVEKYGQMLPEIVKRYFKQERPIELRPVELSRYVPQQTKPTQPHQNIWVRARGTLPDDPQVHRAVLAYLSDMTLLDASLIAHGRSIFNSDLQAASLDHALWMHRPFRADEWMLYSQDSPSSSSALGFSRGTLYSQDGQLIASIAQEGLIRVRSDIKAKTA